MKTMSHVVLLALLTALFGALVHSDELTKEEKTERARRVATAAPYAPEIGGFDEPYKYEHLSDEELERQLAEAQAREEETYGQHKKDVNALQAYEKRLIQDGKTTRSELDIGLYEDRSGKLQELQDRQRVSLRANVDSQLARAEFTLEKDLRKNPDKFLAEESVVQDYAAGGRRIADDWMEKHARMLESDPEAWEFAVEEERRARQLKIQAGVPVLDRPMFPDQGPLPAPGQGLPVGDGVRLPQPSSSLAPEETVFRIGQPKPLPPGENTVLTQSDRLPVPQSQPSSAVTVTYADLYGPDANPAVIEEIEKQEIRRLPSELKKGVPREVQRLFFYGGYEKMPRDQKRHLRHLVKQLKQEAENRQELRQAFGDAYDSAQNVIPPEGLSNQGPANAASAAAYLLMALTHKLIDEVTEATRRRKFEASLEKVTGEIPGGQRESVLLIEDVERRPEFTYGSIPRTLGVSAYRTNIDSFSKEETPGLLGELDDLRKASDAPHEHWYRFRRVYRATVIGSGANLGAKPTIKDALQAGADMGRLARGGRLSMDVLMDIIRNTYARFREWKDTREAFRLAYGAQAQASEELDLAELMDLLDKKRKGRDLGLAEARQPIFDGRWRVKFGNWWILNIQETGGRVSGTIEADYRDDAERRRKGFGTINGERRNDVQIGKAVPQDGISGEILMKREREKWNLKNRTTKLILVDHDLKKFQFRIEDEERLRGEFCFQVGESETIRCRGAQGMRVGD